MQHEKVRCTYGAMADYIGTSPRDVGVYLSPRRPEASWVVSKKSGLRTGYEPYQLHPALGTNGVVIDQVADLYRLLRGA